MQILWKGNYPRFPGKLVLNMYYFTLSIGFGGGPVTLAFLIGIGLAILTYGELKDWAIAFLYNIIIGNAISRYTRRQIVTSALKITIGLILWGIWDFFFIMLLWGCFYAIFGG
jgi:hypothetical protein